MKRLLIIISFLLLSLPILAQDLDSEIVPDSLYREDQFYVGVTYNLLSNKLDGVSQTGLSSGFHLGFVRDMPINKKRNVAIGLGIGLSANSFNQNIKISKINDKDYSYSIVDNSDFSKNKFSQHLIEIPFEFRWRLSSPTEHRFFRLHAGIKTGYVFANTSKYVGDSEDEQNSGIDDFNDFQYGLTFSLGYNTINFYLYYALNPIFDSSANIDQTEIEMKAVKFGFIFYIL